MILLHDDDWLSSDLTPWLPKFYELLEKGDVACCTWRADAVEEDDTHRTVRHIQGGTTMASSAALANAVMAFGHASISPVISVLRRDVLIHACKEAEQFFDIDPKCWHNPGMPYGTEIIVYFRHVEKYPSWFYVDEVLSFYGSHEGSGTIEAERRGGWTRLIKGYDLARQYCANHRGPSIQHKPRILFAWDPYHPGPGLNARRFDRADRARQMLFELGRIVPMMYFQWWQHVGGYPTGQELGDNAVPYLNHIFDNTAKFAMPEDYLCYTNSDICPIIHFEHRMHQLFEDPRRSALVLTRQTFPSAYMPEPPFSEIRNGKSDNGVDGLIVKKAWWLKYGSFFPRMLVGRESWDTVMRALVQESQPSLSAGDVEIPYTLAHEEHDPYWRDSINRRTNPGQRYNLQTAKNYFHVRRRTYGWVDGSVYSKGVPAIKSV
jgi:hypothetical protein